MSVNPILGLIAATALGLTGATAMAEVVKIGLLAPITGPNAGDGQDFVRGVELAIKEANAKGGVAGNPFDQLLL